MSRWLRFAVLAAACVPPLLIAGVIVRDAVDVPFMDQWVFGGTIANAARGGLRPSSLWEPNNEHRVVLPRLVMLGLAKLTGWDVRWELATSFAVALGTLALFAAIIRRTVRPHAPDVAPWLVLVASLQTFSLAQWQNWTWGWQLSIFLNAGATVLAVYLLALDGARREIVAAMLLAALAAVLSFASGFALLLVLPLGLLARDGRRGVEPAAASGAFAVAVALAYFWHFEPVGNPTPHVLPWQAPGAFVAYVLDYLGAGFAAGNPRAAFWWGAAGVLAAAAALLRLWPQRRIEAAPWAVLVAYTIVAGALTAVGRLAAGDPTALLSRYTTVAAPFWTATSALVALALMEPTPTARSRATRQVALALVAVALIAAVPGYERTRALGDATSRARAAAMRRGRECLASFETAPDSCLRLLCWDPKVLRFFAGPLKDLHLGPFRNRP